MYHHIKGEIAEKYPNRVVIEAGGVGYDLQISLTTYSKIEKLERIKLLTYLHVKEDSHTLYGFFDQSERNLFIHLISVSGVGPGTAQVFLSGMTPEELRNAIIGEDLLTLKKVKGIGSKTAQRIILDLKDKLIKEGGETKTLVHTPNNTIRHEALSALTSLGFNRVQVQKVLNSILAEEKEKQSVEELIKKALKKMA